jgi:twitching motility protein PilU
LIERGDLSAIKDAMQNSLAEGSQTFEQDLARLIAEGLVTREEGLLYADSPTNLLWRLQNDMTPVSRVAPKKKEESEAAVYTELTIEVRPDDPRNAPAATRR